MGKKKVLVAPSGFEIHSAQACIVGGVGVPKFHFAADP
jgi:hypothetical protein